MASNNPFRNNYLFTKNHKPRAVGPDTQHSMRWITYFDKAQEEILWIEREVRRAMRWEIGFVSSLLDSFITESDSLSKLASHSTFESLAEAKRKKATMVAIHV